MNSFNESIDLENEVRMLNDRLNMYKSLNCDLSNRIQDLKVQSGSYASELTLVRRELLEEKAKSSEMRRYIKLLNSQCANFFNSFVTNVQQAAENGIDINISTLGIGDNDNDDGSISIQPAIDPSMKFEKTISAIKDRLQSRFIPPVDPSTPNDNLLNTIMEESQLPITSTPMVVGKQVVENDENSFEINVNSYENSRKATRRRSSLNSSSVVIMQTPVKSTPQKSKLSNSKVNSIVENEEVKIQECFVRLSRCPLSEKKASNVNDKTIENIEKSIENVEKSIRKSTSEEPDLQSRPKRSKRPRSGTLTERSVRSKLRRT